MCVCVYWVWDKLEKGREGEREREVRERSEQRVDKLVRWEGLGSRKVAGGAMGRERW